MDIPNEIAIRRNESGGWSVHIDGAELPWPTQGISTPSWKIGDELPSVTLTIPAHRVTVDDGVHIPREWTAEDVDRVTEPMRLQNAIWGGKPDAERID